MRKTTRSARMIVVHELSCQDLDIVVGGDAATTTDTEVVVNIGSVSHGAGAGKVTFNPFSITR